MDLEPYTLESVQVVMTAQSNREKFYILEKEKVILGWAQIKKYSDREGYKYACETAVYLDKQQLRKGYGTYLKKFIIDQCRKFDYNHLVAKIQADNDISILYNEKLGYTIVGKQKKIGFVNGVWKDVVIMQLILD